MQVFNTLSRQKETFVPIEKKKVSIYSCGPTVYGAPHIGNHRSFLFADILRNTLQYIAGYDTTHVMNITDVGHLVSDGDEGEDKMEKGARKDGLTARDVAKKYEDIFLADLDAMAITRFDHLPRATEHIPEQIDLVQKLEGKGYIYKIEGDGMYMDTSKVPNYGELLGPNYKKHIEGLQSGARVEDTGKRNPTDFALRKFSPEGVQRDMERDSPRGKGFPGRHAECSAMSSKYLGDHFDVHTGGVDHIPVHHSNEIAQSECAFGQRPWVNYRMHNAFLTVDGGKMGKSLGNAYTLEDIQAKGFVALDLRYFYLMAQYSKQQDFTREALDRAKSTRKNIAEKVQKHLVGIPSWDARSAEIASAQTYQELPISIQETLQTIAEAFLDDLNTPQVLAALHTALQDPSEDMLLGLYWLESKVLKVGLFDVVETVTSAIPSHIADLAEHRRQAKKAKNYTLADELREKVAAEGFVIKDSGSGYEVVAE